MWGLIETTRLVEGCLSIIEVLRCNDKPGRLARLCQSPWVMYLLNAEFCPSAFRRGILSLNVDVTRLWKEAVSTFAEGILSARADVTALTAVVDVNLGEDALARAAGGLESAFAAVQGAATTVRSCALGT